jgi:hypothetical protein
MASAFEKWRTENYGYLGPFDSLTIAALKHAFNAGGDAALDERRKELEALTVLLRAKCSDREWAEMCKKFDGLAKTVADALRELKVGDVSLMKVEALLARAEEARKP